MTTADSPKNVTVQRHTFTKSEREYIKGIVHNLSLQRLTDQEIVQWLHDEKQIDLDRSTVSKMSNQIDKQAEKWYIELRNSAYKYLAQYKQRIDSLLSYQKTLHEIIYNTKKDEVKIRAISELHSIEMDILSLWKQLPDSNIVNTVDNTENERGKGKKVPWMVQIQEGGEQVEVESETEIEKEPEVWAVNPELPKAGVRIPSHTDETIASNITTEIQETIPIATQMCNIALSAEEPEQKNDCVDIDILGRWPKPFDIEPWIQCNICDKWFKNKEIRSKHAAKYHT